MCICGVSNQVTRVRDCGVVKTLYVPTDIGQNSCIRTDVLNNEAASRCPHDRMCSGAQVGCQQRPKNEVNYPTHAATSRVLMFRNHRRARSLTVLTLARVYVDPQTCTVLRMCSFTFNNYEIVACLCFSQRKIT